MSAAMEAAGGKNRNARLPPEVNRTLYVRNLPFNITSEEMYDIFGGAVQVECSFLSSTPEPG
jgi:RNA recognition motif-containing protein